MNRRARHILIFTTIIIIGLYFFFLGLAKAKGFLIPFSIAVLLSLLLLPVKRKLMSWGIGKGWAVLFSDLIIMLIAGGMVAILGIQINSLANKWPQIKQQLKPRVEKLQQFIEEKTGLSPQEQEERIKGTFQQNGSNSQQGGSGDQQGKNGSASGSSGSFQVKGFLKKVLGFTTDSLLVFVYIFFFLLYSNKFKNSILNFFPAEKRGSAERTIHGISNVAQNYLFGKFVLIFFLAVIYSIGFTVSGVKNAIFIAFLASFLSLIPYIGNVMGVGIALVFAVMTGGSVGNLIGVLITFTITQFIESYVLEPFIVGHRVDLNPVFTIVIVVVGGVTWGVAGMIVAIPFLGIIKVICDRVPAMQPLGYLFGEEDTGSGGGWFQKAEDWFMKKLGKK